MDVSENDWKMEGWLYVIRSNRLGLPYSRKRYFVLQDSCLNCFKSAPLSKKEVLGFLFSFGFRFYGRMVKIRLVYKAVLPGFH